MLRKDNSEAFRWLDGMESGKKIAGVYNQSARD